MQHEYTGQMDDLCPGHDQVRLDQVTRKMCAI
jgi:hypothetical protein